MAIELTMPKIGLNMQTGIVAGWLVEDGKPVQKGQPIYVVETDKVTNDIAAEETGVLYHKVIAGAVVPVAGLVGLIVLPNETLSGASLLSPENDEPSVAVNAHPKLSTTQAESSQRKVLASPAAKRRSKELGIDIAMVPGSGEDGKASIEDVDRYAASLQAASGPSLEAPTKEPASSESVSTPVNIRVTPVARKLAEEFDIDLGELSREIADGRPITREDINQFVKARMQQSVGHVNNPIENTSLAPSGIRALIAQRMLNSAQQTAPVTLFTEVNATNLVQLRAACNRQMEKKGMKKLSYNDFLIYWVGQALSEFPAMNASLEDGKVIHKEQVNIGLAVDTDRGLLVPVVKTVTEKNVLQVHEEIESLVERATAGRLSIEDLEGGTFTITNLGMYGIDTFTPIINLPETAVLGVGRIVEKPVGWNGELVLRHQLVLSMTFDHRLVDGAPAARFLQRLSDLLENDFPFLFN